MSATVVPRSNAMILIRLRKAGVTSMVSLAVRRWAVDNRSPPRLTRIPRSNRVWACRQRQLFPAHGTSPRTLGEQGHLLRRRLFLSNSGPIGRYRALRENHPLAYLRVQSGNVQRTERSEAPAQ